MNFAHFAHVLCVLPFQRFTVLADSIGTGFMVTPGHASKNDATEHRRSGGKVLPPPIRRGWPGRHWIADPGPE